jgi:hypothetical protein
MNVRFRFGGMYRESGKPVEGHVEAPDTEVAYQILSDNGIVTETLFDDPGPMGISPTAVPEFADALESALDSSSSQVPFDDLTVKYSGKKVWVIDRDKIRRRVAQVVDSTLAASDAHSESGESVREQVARAIGELFQDTSSIASQHNAQTIAAMRAMIAATGKGAGIAGMTNDNLAEQIGRLTGVVEQAEGLIAAMQSALRNMETGGVPRRRSVVPSGSLGPEQNEVLREIFQSNLELRRMISRTAPLPVKAA